MGGLSGGDGKSVDELVILIELEGGGGRRFSGEGDEGGGRGNSGNDGSRDFF